MKKWLILLTISFLFLKVHADTFIVSSNADDGPGTLRQAIASSNANGIVQRDFIYFNLSGTSVQAITIVLETELPILSSNIVIDGTSQPTSFLSNNSIKIRLTKTANGYFNGLRLDQTVGVEIYGISFNNFKSDPLSNIADKKAAIYLYNTADFIIGAPNKSNCFTGNYAAILSPYVIPRFDIVNGKISSNIIGLNEAGVIASPNETGIDISFFKNSIIGGDLPLEGNLVSSNINKAIALGGADGEVKVINNIIGLNRTATSVILSNLSDGIFVNGASSRPILKGNIICGQARGIYLDNVSAAATIAGNRIGTGPLGTENFGNEVGIHINFSNGALIGGNQAVDENKIAYNKTGIVVEITYPVAILRNSIYCNTVEAIVFKNLPQNQTITLAPIAEITANGAKGSYLPNSKVELFYLDECSDCQGKTWLATINTDGAGNWSYNGVVSGAITSMGTNQDGATSNFSKTTVNDAAKVMANERCGGSNGSIKGITATNASVFRWYNTQNQLVGSQKDLENVPAGIYKLKVGQNSLCDKEIGPFTLTDVLADVNESGVQIVDANCDLANGSIKNIIVSNNASKTWYNSDGNAIAVSDDLLNVSAGIYYFKTGTGSCVYTSRNYTIRNLQPTFAVSSYQIFDANCEEDNGRILINGYTSARPDSFYWLNENGDIVSTDENPINLAEGTYRFYGKTTVGCEVLIGAYEVGRIAKVQLDLSNKSVVANCNLTRISLQNVTVSGGSMPYQYQWISADGNPISNELNFKSIPIGKYKLIVTDANACEIESELIDFAQDGLEPLKIPNTFTPNGDGINDVWNIKGLTQNEEVTVSVFSRAGQKIFDSVGYKSPFDGIYKGKVLPVGVYFYVINLGSSCDLLKGTLTIAR